MPLFECGNQKILSKWPLWPVFAKDCAVPGGLIVWLFDWWYKMVNDLMGDGTIRLIYGGCTDLYGRMLLSSGSRLSKHHTVYIDQNHSHAVCSQAVKLREIGLLAGTYHRCHEYALGQSLSVLMFCVWSVKCHHCNCLWPAPKVLAQQVPLAEKLAKASASVSNIIFVVSA